MSEPPTSRRAARKARQHGDPPAPADKSNPTPRAGRNLYAAIGTGVLLGALVLVSLFTRKELFIVVATLASVIGVYELLRAMGHGGIHPPAIPTMAAAAGLPIIAYIWGPQALSACVVGALLILLVWCSFGAPAEAVKDLSGAVLVTLYVPTLVSFAMLMLHASDGPGRIVVFIVVTISSDIGGYLFGVIAGKHPMAPSVSPKKSWEGFAGSVLWCVVAGALTVSLVLHGHWWIGAILGSLVVLAATIGDLCESMIKRDLGIKDMGNLIPGHGGLMDRLDSLLLAAPVVWAVLTAFVPIS
ncbi:phosphatidate cytidylyltransferase [Leekyejoonella antrihumi]|uniref:Phosphatidate cytidylyltransferase n=1 Tax=Leekyejoonella antrihumi TaxID=1660198 RepID=A0A563E003_9MICO|nr:phosphatidate cytidylyltransferase [Leekyejoonella antrihumi]TWP35541.1 phosphatidate cytidylyltransferase [Leekyejoonella antrihumi]